MAVGGRETRRRGARAAAGVACLALLLWAWRGRGAGGGGGGRGESAALDARREFPRRAPADIAHRLADFSTLPHALGVTPGSWRVEEERGNVSSWSYAVRWECGAGCAGLARVSAHAPPPRAPPAPLRVTLLVRTCEGAALPARSDACDEMEVAAEVESDGAGGAVLRERARATCAAAAEGEGQGEGGCEARLRAQRARHHDVIAGSI